MQHVVDVELANLNLEQGYTVSKLAQELDVPITITGRWADTPAEAALREQAVVRKDELIVQGLSPDQAILQAAEEFGINPQQVKKSTEKSEVDVFIPKQIWDNLDEKQKQYIEVQLLNTFSVDEVDFYQNIPLVNVKSGWPDPRTNIPPGSITFNPDGTVKHDLLSK